MKNYKNKKIGIISFFLCFLVTDLIASTDKNFDIILSQINHYRSTKGLSSLTNDVFLSTVATNHSLEMAMKNVPFGHAGFQDRFNKIVSAYKQSEGMAENVAYTHDNATTVTQLWLESSGHRKNIEGDYNLTGIGIAYDNYGGVYVTQIFLKKNVKAIS